MTLQQLRDRRATEAVHRHELASNKKYLVSELNGTPHATQNNIITANAVLLPEVTARLVDPSVPAAAGAAAVGARYYSEYPPHEPTRASQHGRKITMQAILVLVGVAVGAVLGGILASRGGRSDSSGTDSSLSDENVGTNSVATAAPESTAVSQSQTNLPSHFPTWLPTVSPTITTAASPTNVPTTSPPSVTPTNRSTRFPTTQPTQAQTMGPTATPTDPPQPTPTPTFSPLLSTAADLRAAVVAYVEDPLNPDSLVAQQYGYPIGSW